MARRVAGVIGDPVAHSLSPAIHNAAFAATGLDWIYVAFAVPRGRAADALRGVRALDLAGLNVTMPHKEDVARACDELTEHARVLRSVNTVSRLSDGRLLGESTDGEGLVRALHADGVELAGAGVLLVGAGGAARAVALGLVHLGGAQVSVWARRPEAAAAVASLDAREIRVVAAADLAAAVARADIVVHATPVGMQGELPPIPTGGLHEGQVVVDLIYHPAQTPLLAAATAAGARAINGLGMLVHQAALAFERWTGVAAPVDVMRAAVEMADSD
jgi:shikimate dehydrogenase